MRLRVVGTLLVAAYPIAVYVGLTRWSGRAVGLLALAALGTLALARARDPNARALAHVPAAGALLALAAVALDDARLLRAWPVVVSLGLLAIFGASLRGEVSIVERFARLRRPDLTAGEVAYCRGVTRAWCGFFVANALACIALALWAPLGWWALYTGGIAYALMGAMFAGEWLVRRARFGRVAPGPQP